MIIVHSKIVKLVKNGVLMIIHIYAKVSKGLKMTKQINTLFAMQKPPLIFLSNKTSVYLNPILPIFCLISLNLTIRRIVIRVFYCDIIAIKIQ
jgi:hypothetical protein